MCFKYQYFQCSAPYARTWKYAFLFPLLRCKPRRLLSWAYFRYSSNNFKLIFSRYVRFRFQFTVSMAVRVWLWRFIFKFVSTNKFVCIIQVNESIFFFLVRTLLYYRLRYSFLLCAVIFFRLSMRQSALWANQINSNDFFSKLPHIHQLYKVSHLLISICSIAVEPVQRESTCSYLVDLPLLPHLIGISVYKIAYTIWIFHFCSLQPHNSFHFAIISIN